MIKYTFNGEYEPTVGTEGSAGLDLCVQKVDNDTVYTGVRVEIPAGWVGLLVPRSSWGINGWSLKNTIGIIDSDYRGEVIIKAKRDSVAGFGRIHPGDRICQLVVVRCDTGFERADELSITDRGDGGFGSTGGD